MQEILGRYFPYCQWCVYDGQCVLLHHEYLGVAAGQGIDREPYPGPENLVWHFSTFQVLGDKMTPRAQCSGRIVPTDSPFFPLACQCGTVIDGGPTGLCAKFSPNEIGTTRLTLAEKIAAEKKIPIGEVPFRDLPPPNPKYRSEMDIYFPDFLP